MNDEQRFLPPAEVSDLAKELLAKLKARQSAPQTPETQAEAEERHAQFVADEKARQAENELRSWKARLRKCAPISRWECAWEPKPTEAVKAVEAWIASGCQRHMVLFGGVGCGKSVAAACAVKHWVKNGDPVTWLTHDELVSAVLHAYDDRSPRIYRKVVIDDMGRERKPEFADALCDLLDMPDVTILITSNLTTPQFKERYTDPRLLDRLNDSCAGVRIKSPSMRAGNGGF